jgi:hypothetical protein
MGAGLVLALFASAGCAENGLGPDGTTTFDDQSPEMSMDLAALDGGTGIQAESPAFGDAYMKVTLGEDERVLGDPLESDPALRDAEIRPGARVFYLRAVWGNLTRAHGDDDASAADTKGMDWSGYAEVNEGLLLPARLIAFDRRDRLVPPWRSDTVNRRRVEWVSHTGPHVDGILFKIVIPTPADTALLRSRPEARGDGLTADDAFTFEAGGVNVRFPIAELAGLDSTIMVDDVNGVTFSAFDRDDVDRCPRGLMVGAWVKTRNDSLSGGFFRAKWVGAAGHLAGHVRGRWGVLDDGSRVFVGKIIGRGGEYLGHLRGTWEPDAGNAGRGTFSGGWYVHNEDGSRELHGRVRGRWAQSRRIEDGGFLRGVWGANCGDGTEGAGGRAAE